MSLELSSMFTLMVLGAPGLLLVMLIPTLFEIRKPKDAGPRLIMPDFCGFAKRGNENAFFLEDIDDHEQLDFLIIPMIKDALSTLRSIDG